MNTKRLHQLAVLKKNGALTIGGQNELDLLLHGFASEPEPEAPVEAVKEPEAKKKGKGK